MASRSFSCVLGVVFVEKVGSYICNVVKTISCNSQWLTMSSGSHTRKHSPALKTSYVLFVKAASA